MSGAAATGTPDGAGSAPVPSPCVNVCRMNPATGLCDGCRRTLDEIATWASMDDDAKRAVWLQLERRRAGAVEGIG